MIMIPGGLMEGDKARLSAFPARYTRVLQHSRFADITYEELHRIEGRQRLLGEFLAMAGKDSVRFDILKKAIILTDRYLRDGVWDEEAICALEPQLAAEALTLLDFVPDLIQGGCVDHMTLDGTPVVCQIFADAVELFNVCRVVENLEDPRARSTLRAELWQNRRTDLGGPEPEPEKTPELV